MPKKTDELFYSRVGDHFSLIDAPHGARENDKTRRVSLMFVWIHDTCAGVLKLY